MTTEKKISADIMETRVAILEQSVIQIFQTLVEIRNDVRDLRIEIKELQKESKADFRWLLATIGGLGIIMANGFHWI